MMNKSAGPVNTGRLVLAEVRLQNGAEAGRTLWLCSMTAMSSSDDNVDRRTIRGAEDA